MILEIFREDILLKAKKLVCLDRDNTLIRDSGYMGKSAEIQINDDLLGELLSQNGDETSFCLVSNQSGIGRGFITFSDVINLNRKLSSTLSSLGLNLSLSIFCPHTSEDGCGCRKPKDAMLKFVERVHENIDRELSVMYGDRSSDEEAALRANFHWKQAPSFFS